MNILENISFSTITTLKIGGLIKVFVIAKTKDEIFQSIERANREKLPYIIIGGGSNLLVADSGFSGVVIKNSIRGMEISDGVFIASSGTDLQELVDFANENGIGGFEKLAGIPGTVGGAVYGNAGAYGQVISDNLMWVDVARSGEVIRLNKEECGFGYRDSGFERSKDIILTLGFSMELGDSKRLMQIAKELIKKREQKYHPDISCPGSFFKNVEADKLVKEVLTKIPEDKIMFGKIPAGWLLEEVGAKGASRGGVKIAEWHANLFINTGNGTAEDFVTLAKEYKNKVKEKFGITLGPEVQLIGFTSEVFV